MRGALIALDAFAREHLHVDYRTRHAGGHAQAGVFDVGRLLAENRTQQFFFRGQLGFAFGRYLAHQHIARFDFGTDINDAGFIQPARHALGQIGNVARDFFRPEFGVARHNRQFLDMNRGVAIVRHHAFGDEDRVFEVVTVPRHERDHHVLPQSQLTHIGGSTVGDNVAARNYIAHFHDRALIDVGVLVGTGELGQGVNIHAHFACRGFVVIDAHHDARSIDIIHNPAATGEHHGAGVDGGGALDAGTDYGFLWTQARHSLALHVGAHQRAVRVVMLEEGDQRRGHRHDLRRRHVHVFHFLARGECEFVVLTAGNKLFLELAALIQLGVGLSDHILAFFNCRQIFDLIRHLAVNHFAIRRL